MVIQLVFNMVYRTHNIPVTNYIQDIDEQIQITNIQEPCDNYTSHTINIIILIKIGLIIYIVTVIS